MAVKMGVYGKEMHATQAMMIQAAQAGADDRTMLPRLGGKVGHCMCEGLDYVGYISHVHSGVALKAKGQAQGRPRYGSGGLPPVLGPDSEVTDEAKRTC